MKNKITLSVCLGLVLLSSVALAQKTDERRRTLEGQPAVRHRYELRAGRFEIGPSFGFSLDRAMRHAFTIGAKLEYHFSDAFSVGADLGYGIGFNTGLASELEGSYEKENTAAEPDKGTKKWNRLTKRMSDIKFQGDVRFAWTPIYGRLAVFSKLFVLYDMYAFGGVALAYTANDGKDGEWTNPTTGKVNIDQVDAANEGFRAGLALGVGMRIYFNNWIAMGLEVKDLMFMDNETGADQTRGLSDSELDVYKTCQQGANPASCAVKPKVDSEDKKFAQHWFFGINVTFHFPMQPKVSD